jgi:branched-chain amino acid transport system permease protein
LFRRLFKDFRFSVLPVPGRIIAIVFFVALFFIPLITDKNYYLFVFTISNLLVIFAVSWDLLSGYSGQVNFGHALFFGVSAYTVGLLNKYFGLQPWATIPIGTLVATGIGVVTCIPALRLRGPYLSLLTMSFPLVLLGLVMAFKKWTGGEFGIPGIPGIAATRTGEYYICLIVMTVAVLIMWKLTDAGSRYIRTGLIFHAIREDEIAARASGINTIRYKILAFAIGGFFCGLAGALYTHILGAAGISTLSMTLSFQAIIYVVFGGIVSIYGAVVGVYVLNTSLQLLGQGGQNFIGQNLILIMAILVILVLLFMPEGVAVWIRDKIERECPRCKLTNVAWRRECRACGASLYTERKAVSQ